MATRLASDERFVSAFYWCEKSVGVRHLPRSALTLRQWNGLEARRCGPGPACFGKKDVHYAPETRFCQDKCKKAGQQQNQEQHDNHVFNEAFGVPSANIE